MISLPRISPSSNSVTAVKQSRGYPKNCSCDLSTRDGVWYRTFSYLTWVNPFGCKARSPSGQFIANLSELSESVAKPIKGGRCCSRWVQASHSSRTAVMLVPTPDDPMSIFKDGSLKPGVYKVQNLGCQTYLEVQEHSRGLCCRPATVLSPEDALVISSHHALVLECLIFLNASQWEFQPLGSGYKIKKVCTAPPLVGYRDGRFS